MFLSHMSFQISIIGEDPGAVFTMVLPSFEPRVLSRRTVSRVRPLNRHFHASQAVFLDTTSRQKLFAAQVAFLHSIFLVLVSEDVPLIIGALQERFGAHVALVTFQSLVH